MQSEQEVPLPDFNTVNKIISLYMFLMSIILYLIYVLQLNILCRSECLVSNCINSQRKHKYKHITKPRKHKQKQKSKGYLSSINWNIINV